MRPPRKGEVDGDGRQCGRDQSDQSVRWRGKGYGQLKTEEIGYLETTGFVNFIQNSTTFSFVKSRIAELENDGGGRRVP